MTRSLWATAKQLNDVLVLHRYKEKRRDSGDVAVLGEPFSIYYGFDCITVPAGFSTDFASVPWVARWLISSLSSIEAAIVHDYLYIRSGYSKELADAIFLSMMEQDGSPWWRRTLMYQAVKWFGGSSYKGYRYA